MPGPKPCNRFVSKWKVEGAGAASVGELLGGGGGGALHSLR